MRTQLPTTQRRSHSRRRGGMWQSFAATPYEWRFEALLDKGRHVGTGIAGPDVLYHYTSWEAAEAILRGQRFRARAHDCTNDKDELRSADNAILESTRALRDRSTGLVGRAAQQFLESYPETCIGAVNRTYLVCFSTKRDDARQWSKYGRGGQGVCLGFRLLNIPGPNVPGIATAFMPVEYGVEQLHAKVLKFFSSIEEYAGAADNDAGNLWKTIQTLNNNATSWALSTKNRQWESEAEVRMIFLTREGRTVKPESFIDCDGQPKRFILVPVTELPLMPLSEMIVGPGFTHDRAQVIDLLTDLGYPEVDNLVTRSTLNELEITDAL